MVHAELEPDTIDRMTLPELHLADWRPTKDTLHLYCQIVGTSRMGHRQLRIEMVPDPNPAARPSGHRGTRLRRPDFAA